MIAHDLFAYWVVIQRERDMIREGHGLGSNSFQYLIRPLYEHPTQLSYLLGNH
jgi:hypothetical protein